MARLEKFNARGHSVHYRAKSIERSLAFYVRLGFRIDFLDSPASAQASMGDLTLFLTRLPESEWHKTLGNRRHLRKGIVIDVDDLEAHVETLKRIGFRFRNDIEQGPAGKRMRLEDPDGNPVELVERSRAHGAVPEGVAVLTGRAAAMMSAAHDRPLASRYALSRR
ncbi:MAG TPA: VOC family protein [Burkholderiales bacterium]|nr:VOC family protein [Burkholderiales bacterium]